ncbi:MAG: hypothetical protein AB7F64_01745 [Gammaproteobacteria bacterium]
MFRLEKIKDTPQTISDDQKNSFVTNVKALINKIVELSTLATAETAQPAEDRSNKLLRVLINSAIDELGLIFNTQLNNDTETLGAIRAIIGLNVLFDIEYAKRLSFDYLTVNNYFTDKQKQKEFIDFCLEVMHKVFGLFVHFPTTENYHFQNRISLVSMTEPADDKEDKLTSLLLSGIEAFNQIFKNENPNLRTFLRTNTRINFSGLAFSKNIYSQMAAVLYQQSDRFFIHSFKIVSFFHNLAKYCTQIGSLKDALDLYQDILEYLKLHFFDMHPFVKFSNNANVTVSFLTLFSTSFETILLDKSIDIIIEDKQANISDCLFQFSKILHDYATTIIASWEIATQEQKTLALNLLKASEAIESKLKILFASPEYDLARRKIEPIPSIELEKQTIARLNISDEFEEIYNYWVLPKTTTKNPEQKRKKLSAILKALLEFLDKPSISGIKSDKSLEDSLLKSINPYTLFPEYPSKKNLKQAYYPKLDISHDLQYPELFINLLLEIAATLTLLSRVHGLLVNNQSKCLCIAYDLYAIIGKIIDELDNSNKLNNQFLTADYHYMFALLLLEIAYSKPDLDHIIALNESSNNKSTLDESAPETENFLQKNDFFFVYTAISELHKALYQLNKHYLKLKKIPEIDSNGYKLYVTLSHAKILYRLSQAYYLLEEFDIANFFIQLARQIITALDHNANSFFQSLNIFYAIVSRKTVNTIEASENDKPIIKPENFAQACYMSGAYDQALAHGLDKLFLVTAFSHFKLGNFQLAMNYIWVYLIESSDIEILSRAQLPNAVTTSTNASDKSPKQLTLETSYVRCITTTLFGSGSGIVKPLEQTTKDRMINLFLNTFYARLHEYTLILQGEKTPWAKLQTAAELGSAAAELLPDGFDASGGLSGGVSVFGCSGDLGGSLGGGLSGVIASSAISRANNLLISNLTRRSTERAKKVARLLGKYASDDNKNDLITWIKTRLLHNFADQIYKLSDNGIHTFVLCCVKRIFSYLIDGKSNLALTEPDDFLLFALLNGEGKAALETKNPQADSDWHADELLTRCGIKVDDKNYYTRTDKSQDLHLKYGFRLGTQDEIDKIFESKTFTGPYASEDLADADFYASKVKHSNSCVLF